jgi:HAE1 family hydrophobic/amphiphilic exporter-1
MILGNGTGSEFRQPLGWAICGGLLVSQVLTLFSTPVVYYYLDKVRRRLGDEARHPSRAHSGPAAPAAAKELTLGGE